MSGKAFTAGEFYPIVVDLSTNSTIISTTQTMLRGVYVNTVLSAQECAIKSGTATIMRIPAGTAGGTWLPFGDAVLGAGITVDPDDSATGEIAVICKVLP